MKMPYAMVDYSGKKCEMPNLRNGEGMKLDEYKEITKALRDITIDQFLEVLLPHYNQNRDYIQSVWNSFNGDRIGFCLSRQPIQPGDALIEYAIVRTEER